MVGHVSFSHKIQTLPLINFLLLFLKENTNENEDHKVKLYAKIFKKYIFIKTLRYVKLVIIQGVSKLRVKTWKGERRHR